MAESLSERAEQLIADCEIGTHCRICAVLRGLLEERLSVRQAAARETVESLGRSGWLSEEDVPHILATLPSNRNRGDVHG